MGLASCLADLRSSLVTEGVRRISSESFPFKIAADTHITCTHTHYMYNYVIDAYTALWNFSVFLIPFQLVLSWQGKVWEENCRTSGGLWGRSPTVAWHPIPGCSLLCPKVA